MLKTNICSPEKLECVSNIRMNEEHCLNLCDGIVLEVTKVDYLDEKKIQEGISKLLEEYEDYKSSRTGNVGHYEPTLLHFIRIYFSTSSVDKIEKESFTVIFIIHTECPGD